MRRSTTSTSKASHESRAAAPFDLSTVKTKSSEPAASSVSRKSSRLFGIQEAPTFYPTRNEFKDPLGYIEKISPEGEKYGIIKIVPPEDYNPDFSLKTESFRFKARIQILDGMDDDTRTNNYLEQIKKYHKSISKSDRNLPLRDKRLIDLYKLKDEVIDRGGVEEVTRLKKWAEIGRELGYTDKQSSMSKALKKAYYNFVVPYELWYGKHKIDIDQFTLREDNGPSSSPSNSAESDDCEICHKNEDEEKLLLCDGCNRAFHMYCLDPALTSVPETDWFCLQCLAAVEEDYGFEDVNEYSLNDFQTVCDNFKNKWFKKTHPNGSSTVTEEECENEFWRLVNNPLETCKVLYGTDLHGTQHGSGFATVDHLQQDAVVDPWNLNVIPVVPQSLFTYINSDISGMMVPWLYVGMCFSALCWHNEDHYTYSINYMHWGETKTWYGVPGSDTAKFEDVMRKAVPEQFKQQPDLVFQLVKMLSPERLKKENVDVYAVDQRPGQFVITFPKAYHSGFNHGFNFCETVNFAPSEWIDYGLEYVMMYKHYRRQPCSSHDNLLVTAAQLMKSVENIDWLKRGLDEMKNREMAERQHVRASKLEERVVAQADVREDLQCVFCNCYSYLSYIGCSCTHKVACLEHVTELCTCDISSKVMHLQFTDNQLEELVQRVTHSGLTPDEWAKKVDTVFSLGKALDMKKIRGLIRDAHKFNVAQHDIDNLNEFIAVLDPWVADAEQLLGHTRGRKSDNAEHAETRYERCQQMIKRARDIGVDLVLVAEIKTYAAELKDLDDQITDELFASNDTESQKSLLDLGKHLRSDSVKFRQLKSFLEYPIWEQGVQEAYDAPFNSKNYKKWIKKGEEMGLTVESDAAFKRLVDRDTFARKITQYIQSVIKGKTKIDRNNEQALLDIGRNTANPDLSIALDPALLDQLRDSLTKSNKTLEDLEKLFNKQCKQASVRLRPDLREVQRLITPAREMCYESPLPKQLTDELARNDGWDVQLRSTLLLGRQKGLEAVLKEILANVKRITSSEGKPKRYCICRDKEKDNMIECEICHERYHVSCLGVAPRTIAQSTTAYHCPACQPTTEALQKIPHQSKQPTLQEIEDLITSAERLSFCHKYHKDINQIYNIMLEYRNDVQAFCSSKQQLDHTDLDRIKFYLRALLGLEVPLQTERDILSRMVNALPPVVETTTTSSTLPSSISSPPNVVYPAVNHASSLNHNNQATTSSSLTPDSSSNASSSADHAQHGKPLSKKRKLNDLSNASSPVDHAKTEKPTSKRKLRTTVRNSPVEPPRRPPTEPLKVEPTRKIKLTLKPPVLPDASSPPTSNRERKQEYNDAGNPNKRKK